MATLIKIKWPIKNETFSVTIKTIFVYLSAIALGSEAHTHWLFVLVLQIVDGMIQCVEQSGDFLFPNQWPS